MVPSRPRPEDDRGSPPLNVVRQRAIYNFSDIPSRPLIAENSAKSSTIDLDSNMRLRKYISGYAADSAPSAPCLTFVEDIVGRGSNRVTPMDDEDEEVVDFGVIDAAIRAMGGLEPSDEDRPVALLDRVEGALKELLKLQEELSEIIERQVERRSRLIESERMTGIQHWLMSLSDPFEQ